MCDKVEMSVEVHMRDRPVSLSGGVTYQLRFVRSDGWTKPLNPQPARTTHTSALGYDDYWKNRSQPSRRMLSISSCWIVSSGNTRRCIRDNTVPYFRETRWMPTTHLDTKMQQLTFPVPCLELNRHITHSRMVFLSSLPSNNISTHQVHFTCFGI